MDNQRILHILGYPAEFVGKPEWADMMFAVRRLMEKNDIYKRQLESRLTDKLKHLTISQYFDLVNEQMDLELDPHVIKCTISEVRDYQDLSYFLSDWTYGNLWAYSMKELDYCLEEEKDICVVLLTNGKEVLAELPEGLDV